MGKRRKSLTFSRRSAPGTQPGTLVAPTNAEKTVCRVMAYSEADLHETTAKSVEEILALRQRFPVVWVDVSGLADVAFVQKIGSAFGLHPLALEDVLDGHQRPKIEEFPENVFMIARTIKGGPHIDTDQIAFFLGKDFLLTFQEFASGCFDPVWARLREGRGQMRQSGPDYLNYALLDAIIDAYFPVLEQCGEELDHIEEKIIASPLPQDIERLHNLKRDLLVARRAIWPHREMINAIIRNENHLFQERTRLYLRDAYDHTIQLMDFIETYREISSGLIDVYISSASARLNEIMKVLTVIATVFMPLGFITGYFGMNFNTQVSPWNMPELGWRFGYFYAIFLMVLTVGGLVWYFWHKGWIGAATARPKSADSTDERPG